MTRRDLVDAMSRPINIRRLASYETGDRGLDVELFWRICRAIPATPQRVLDAALDTLGVADREVLTVDLRVLARDGRTDLLPLRAWVATLPAGTNVVRIPLSALPPLADLCGLPVTALHRRLQALAQPHPSLDLEGSS